MLHYSPCKGKKLRLDAIPTLHLPLPTSSILIKDGFDQPALSTAGAFHTPVPLPVSVANTFHEEMSQQMSSNVLLTKVMPGTSYVPITIEAFPVFSLVSNDASSSTVSTDNKALPFSKM